MWGGLGLGIPAVAVRRVGGSAPAIPLTSIDADGWQATYNTTPPSTLLDTPFTATGINGFDSTGTAVTNKSLSTGLYITRRLRVAGSASLQATKVGLSKIIPQGATVAGVTNNSTRVAPVPVANWATRFNTLIGAGDRTVEVTAAHYYAEANGSQVACVEFTMSDGTTTLNRKVTAMAVSGESTDQKAVYVYRAVFPAVDVATLANGQITYQCNVYPHIGTAASIAKTSDSGARGFPVWKFAPRYDVKDTGRFAALPRCYLDAAGVDATGVWSATDATASANPFLTFAGAVASAKLAAIPAGSVIPAGHTDGCEIRMRAGTFVIAGSGASIDTKGANLILTRASGTAKADAICTQNGAIRLRINQGATAYANMAGAFAIVDCTFNRVTITQANDTIKHAINFVNIIGNWGALNGPFGGANYDLYYWGGTVITNVASTSASALGVSSGGGVGIMRGCDISCNGSAVYGYNIVGCKFNALGGFAPSFAAMNPDNTTVGFNRMSADVDTSFNYCLTGTMNGGWFVGNVEEWTTTASNPVWRVTADSDTGSSSHILEDHCTYAGADNMGRHNDRYVWNSAPAASATRTQTWGRTENNIKVQYNTKHDTQTPADATRIGGWEVAFGVGNGVNYIQFLDAGDGGFAADWYPPGTTIGTSRAVGLDPRFKSPQHVTLPGPVAGAGNGDYRLMRISEGNAFDSPCLTGAVRALLPGFGTVLGAWP